MQTNPAQLTLGTPLGRVDAGAFIVTRSVYQPGQVLPLHGHAHASVTVVLHGTVGEHVGGRRFECGPDRFLVRPAAAVHGNVYGPCGAECLIVGARADWVATDSVARDVFSVPRVAAAPALLVVARRIRREMRIGDRAAELAVEGLALEVIAAAARQLADRRYRSPPRWLQVVRELLHDDLVSDIRIHVIARRAGVHPVHLARAFRQCFGCSPGEYARQRRIDRACMQLGESSRSIAEIALDAGFSSPSHFATVFRRATGMSPRDYRTSSQRVFDS